MGLRAHGRDPWQGAAKHQSLRILGEGTVVGCSEYGQEAALAKAGVGRLVLPAIEQGGPIEAWIMDDAGLPKEGGIRSE